jgi:single-strand DNA-binding protein
MNKAILMGRLTRDPETRYTDGETPLAISHYTLAVPRQRAYKTGDDADFIKCSAFGRTAEFAEKYLNKGMKIVVVGHIRTGSYTNRDGNKVNTFEVVVEENHFCESKNAIGGEKTNQEMFESATQSELPFN